MTNFDRERGDLSKLIGCSTRGVEFRWDIFRPFLDKIRTGAEVLDVGCGDLVETHYLAHRGLSVTGIDLDSALLELRAERRIWNKSAKWRLRAISLQDICKEERSFDLVTAFDVIEHLPDLNSTLPNLFSLVKPGGLLFATVPNKFASSEIYSRILNRSMRIAGRLPPPGVPHLQYNSPTEWRDFFIETGFEICDWHMAIGPFVNTWSLLFMAPVQLGLMGAETLHFIDRETRHAWQSQIGLRAPFPELFHWVDEWMRPLSSNLFAWNLVVLRRP